MSKVCVAAAAASSEPDICSECGNSLAAGQWIYFECCEIYWCMECVKAENLGIYSHCKPGYKVFECYGCSRYREDRLELDAIED